MRSLCLQKSNDSEMFYDKKNLVAFKKWWTNLVIKSKTWSQWWPSFRLSDQVSQFWETWSISEVPLLNDAPPNL